MIYFADTDRAKSFSRATGARRPPPSAAPENSLNPRGVQAGVERLWPKVGGVGRRRGPRA